MDWADDVAYSVHDVEDGVHAGHVTLAALRDPAERAAVCELAADTYSAESRRPTSTPCCDELLATCRCCATWPATTAAAAPWSALKHRPAS